MFRNVSLPFSFSSSTSVQKSVSHLYLPLCLFRPFALDLYPGTGISRDHLGCMPWYRIQLLVSCTSGLYLWCLWVFSAQGAGMYLLAPWETLHSKFIRQDVVSPAQPRMSVCPAHLAASSWSCPQLPGWQFPWASASYGFSRYKTT